MSTLLIYANASTFQEITTQSNQILRANRINSEQLAQQLSEDYKDLAAYNNRMPQPFAILEPFNRFYLTG
uniref:Pepsin-I3 domain-containing protein n=1 Tax=Rhabditophanes sp. KR3021 TaxID=114890 RepID=A0AC35UCM8_9BILA